MSVRYATAFTRQAAGGDYDNSGPGALSNGTADFTAWVMFYYAGRNNGNIIRDGDGSTNSWRLRMSDAVSGVPRLTLEFSDAINATVTLTGPALGVGWHIVAVSYEFNANLQLYLNGMLVAENSALITTMNPSTVGAEMQVSSLIYANSWALQLDNADLASAPLVTQWCMNAGRLLPAITGVINNPAPNPVLEHLWSIPESDPEGVGLVLPDIGFVGTKGSFDGPDDMFRYQRPAVFGPLAL